MSAGVVGVDFSLTGCGIASSLGWLELVKSAGKENATYRELSARIDEHSNRVLEFVAGADFVVLEGPSFGSKGSGVFSLAGGWWKLYRSLLVADVPVAIAPPSSVKLYATGKGNAGKGAIIDAVARRWPGFPTGGDENLADAAVLCVMGIDHESPTPTFGVSFPPQTHRKALAGVQWPTGVDQ